MKLWCGVLLSSLTVAASSLSSLSDAAAEYCASFETLEASRRPPLLDSSLDLDLIQVQAIVRHGSRTPADFTECWEGYENHWNCETQELMGATTAQPTSLGETRIFPKIYDALEAINYMNGTCGVGQLLTTGFMQMQKIGEFLADAYFVRNSSWKIPSKEVAPPLINFDDETTDENELYFRTSDLQRTQMSGIALVDSLLNRAMKSGKDISIPIHTIDLNQDYVYPNGRTCPELHDAMTEAFTSSNFTNWRLERKSLFQKLRPLLKTASDLSYWFPAGLFDCLMVAVCDDRPGNIPNELLPGTDLFEETWAAMQEHEAFHARYNDAKFSRMALREFFRVIRRHILWAVDQQSGRKKFLLWVAHDTTLMPFLLSIEGDLHPEITWPPYGSMALIETYRGADDNYFRLIYNGRDLTPRISGCAEACASVGVCELSRLLKATDWATEAAPCLVKPAQALPSSFGALSHSPRRRRASRTTQIMAIALGCLAGGLMCGCLLGATYEKVAAGRGGHRHNAEDGVPLRERLLPRPPPA